MFYRPRQALQELACSAPFVLASVSLTTSPPALNHPNGAEYTSGSAGSPMAYMFPCVRFACFVRSYPLSCLVDSAPLPEKPPTVLYASGMDAQTEIRIIISSTDATLGMGGWLSLTQSGLSPDKKRQAYSWRTRPGYLCGKTSIGHHRRFFCGGP